MSNSDRMQVVLGVPHMHKGRGPVWQLHHGPRVVMYSSHLAAFHHLSYPLTHYIVQQDASWW